MLSIANATADLLMMAVWSSASDAINIHDPIPVCYYYSILACGHSNLIHTRLITLPEMIGCTKDSARDLINTKQGLNELPTAGYDGKYVYCEKRWKVATLVIE